MLSISCAVVYLVLLTGVDVRSLTPDQYEKLTSKVTEAILDIDGFFFDEEKLEENILCILKHCKNEFETTLLRNGEEVYWDTVAKWYHAEAVPWSDQDICGSDVAAFVRVLLQARRNFIKQHRLSTTPEHVICAYLDTLILLIEQNPGDYDMGGAVENHGFADQVRPETE